MLEPTQELYLNNNFQGNAPCFQQLEPTQELYLNNKDLALYVLGVTRTDTRVVFK